MVAAADKRQRSSVRRLLWVIVSSWMTYAGCLSLNLPPDKVDGAAGDSRTEVTPASDTRAGGDIATEPLRDAAGTGGTTTGTGGIGGALTTDTVAAGTGGFAVETGGAGGRFTPATAATGGMTGALRGSGGAAENRDAASSGGTAGSDGRDFAEETCEDAVDAPPSDVPPDTPVAAPTAGLIMYLPCEAADGTNLQDKSGVGNNGQILTASASGYKFESGKIGNGLTLSQVESAYVALHPQIFRGLNALTIAVWIKANTLTPLQRLFDLGVNANLSQTTATGTEFFCLTLKDPSGKLALASTKDGFSALKLVSVDGFGTGEWKHVAVVVVGGGATIYLDGSPAGTTSSLLPPGALGPIDYAFIGKSQFSSDPFIDAEIDEFRVYNRALAADEIRLLFEYAGP